MADRVEVRDSQRVEVREPAPLRVEVREGTPGSPGPQGATAVSVRELLVGNIDGVNAAFTTSADFASASTLVYLNGLAQSVPDDYVEVPPNEVVMVEPPLTGDRLLITYTEA